MVDNKTQQTIAEISIQPNGWFLITRDRKGRRPNLRAYRPTFASLARLDKILRDCPRTTQGLYLFRR
jgi:hypothetical protein